MRSRRLVGDRRGAAVVEFALVFPILMLLVFAIIDFARAYYTVNVLASAAREGARFASAMDLRLDCIPKACDDDITPIRQRVDTVIARAAITLPADDRIFVKFDGQNVSVELHSYPYQPMTPIVNLIGTGVWYMDRKAVFRWERAP